ncbi:peptidase S41-like protein [Gelidibacter algens]|uniref:Peptidase S41-like protein n=2 Tax=Gelidibacter algens TaxID=49280 RepID=A0A1A7R2Z8_9FLAO|nr:hypothetical protein A9996_11595 [Gelidibacter algens]RAJ20030.1 peptidase S41-like protein [Gelidibacter algens]
MKGDFPLVILIGLFLSFSTFSIAQLTNDHKKQILLDIGKVLSERYVFPEKALSMESIVLENLIAGNYDTITNGSYFAAQLTKDLRGISKDLHLSVSYNGNETSTESNPSKEAQEQEQWLENILKENSFGVTKTAIIEGNIGYIEMPLFGPLDRCADTLVAAMAKVVDTKALILDLRNCRGSLDENAIPFLCSYFFKESVHLFDFYVRKSNSTKQFWTYSWLPYQKYVDKPIYILTSGRTFSGGEELSYDLQQQNRGIVIGEITKGGANPTEKVLANSNYSVAVPYMQSINPISKTNWDGIGVVPDIQVNSNMALHIAHRSALDTIFKTTYNSMEKEILATQIKNIELAAPQFRKTNFILKGFKDAKEVSVSGSFNFWGTPLSLTKHEDVWRVEAEVATGIVHYKFIVDGQWIIDPDNPRTTKANGHTNSVLEIN